MIEAFYFIGIFMLKSIPNYPHYFADEKGNIYSMKPRKAFGRLTFKSKPLMLSQSCRDGYRRVLLYDDEGKRKTVNVHRIILETFVGPAPKDMIACHGPLGKYVNTVKNLYWGTFDKNNGIDKHRDGTNTYGEKVHTAKLNELQVRIIRALYKSEKKDYNKKYLASIFNVSFPNINAIVNYKTWRHIH